MAWKGGKINQHFLLKQKNIKMIKICLRGKIQVDKNNWEEFGDPKKIFGDPKKGRDPQFENR